MSMRMMWAAGAAVLALSGTPVVAHNHASDDAHEAHADHDMTRPHLGHAWVRTPLGGRDVTAAYGRLHNPTSIDDRLLAVTSPIASAIELHSSEDDGEVVRMVKKDALDSPADTHVELEPGGLHMMLFGVNEALAEGDEVSFTLTFEQAGEVQATAVVAQAQPEARRAQDDH